MSIPLRFYLQNYITIRSTVKAEANKNSKLEIIDSVIHG
jgi:hypothetical protein